MRDYSAKIRSDTLSGDGIFGGFLYPYHEELEKSKFFLETMEAFVETSERKEVESLSIAVGSLTPEQMDEYWQWHYPNHWQEIFSNRIRASFVMQLCSFVEGELGEISQRVAIVSAAPLKASDLQGSTLSKPRKYLSAFASLDKPTDDLWTTVERIFDIRNVMVHEAGFAGKNRNYRKIVEFAKGAPGLSLNNDHVEVKREFCEYCLASVSEFCKQLHDSYEAYREAKNTLERLERPSGA